MAAAENAPSTYIPYDQALRSQDQADVVPGVTGYGYQNIDPQMVLDLGLDKMDPDTAAFFGYKSWKFTLFLMS